MKNSLTVFVCFSIEVEQKFDKIVDTTMQMAPGYFSIIMQKQSTDMLYSLFWTSTFRTLSPDYNCKIVFMLIKISKLIETLKSLY